MDALASIVKDRGFDTVLFAASVLSADVASGLSARLQAGLNWDLTDLVQQDGLIGKRPALGDSVLVDVGWRSEPRLALIRAGTFDPQETGGDARSRRSTPSSRTSRRRRPWSSAPTPRAKGRRSRMPT